MLRVSFCAFTLSFILQLMDRTMAPLVHLFVCPAESYTTHHLKASHAAETRRRGLKAHQIILKTLAQLEYSEYTPEQFPTGANKVLLLSFFVLETR